MKPSPRLLIVASIIFLASASACRESGSEIIDKGIVIAEKAQVSNSTALVAAPLAELKRGDEVDILERRTVNQRDFTRVRVVSNKPVEGWMESYLVISKRVVDECNKLDKEWKEISTQAEGKTKDKLKLRLKPGRDSEVALLLTSGAKIEVLGRARAERKADSESSEKPEASESVRYDNWYKVRLQEDSLIKAGWIYADSIELTPPEGISGLLGAGKRFAAWKAFGKAADPETKRDESHYVILDKYAYSKDDEIDFDRIYVVVWDIANHGYSSIYIESLLRGVYPMKLETKGEGYAFTVQLIGKSGKPAPVNYEIKKNPKTGQFSVSRILVPKPKPVKK